MESKRHSDDDLLMLSGIQHIAFCERQWGLIHIEQQWEENLRSYGVERIQIQYTSNDWSAEGSSK